MKRLVDLGAFVNAGRPFAADLDLILSSNLLCQANSGGGKSWLLRRMIERSFGMVPQIIIDPEGEFSTLRGAFDIILVGKDGDTPADVRSAELLAHRLLELGVSAVIDLFEMSPLLRPSWAAIFLHALVDAPKRLWRELLVHVDEAHMLAPEPGHGAADSDAHRRCRGAMIEMASRGRKRGYGLVAATQRLGKLSKDFAAELKNVMIGQTFIDIDRERAAGSLGVAKADKGEFDRKVKNLPPGQFFAMGRALALEPALVRIGAVLTEHPEAGRRQSAPPPPTDKIRHLLPQLADLPKEAEQKVLTEAELRKEIARLRQELAKAAAEKPAAEKRVAVPVVPKGWRGSIQQLRCGLDALTKHHDDSKAKGADLMVSLLRQLAALEDMSAPEALKQELSLLAERVALGKDLRRSQEKQAPPPSDDSVVIHLGAGERRVLTAIFQHSEGVTREQLTILTGYRRSTRDTYLQRLRAAGFVEEKDGVIASTAEGASALGPGIEPLPTGRALLQHWLRELPKGEGAVLAILVNAFPGSLSRDEISQKTEYGRSTRDTYIQRLRSRKLVECAGREVFASAMLFDGGERA
jgi:uncharacterized protein